MCFFCSVSVVIWINLVKFVFFKIIKLNMLLFKEESGVSFLKLLIEFVKEMRKNIIFLLKNFLLYLILIDVGLIEGSIFMFFK